MPSITASKRPPEPSFEPYICTSDVRPQRRSISARSHSSSLLTATRPPLPPLVMMCERAKLVMLMSVQVPVVLPRNSAPRVSAESSITLRS